MGLRRCGALPRLATHGRASLRSGGRACPACGCSRRCGISDTGHPCRVLNYTLSPRETVLQKQRRRHTKLRRMVSTPCGTRTRNLRIRSPPPCPLGQGGHICFVSVRKAFQNKAVWHLQGAQRGASDPLMKKPPTWSLTATGAGLGALGLRGVPRRLSCQARVACPRASSTPLS